MHLLFCSRTNILNADKKLSFFTSSFEHSSSPCLCPRTKQQEDLYVFLEKIGLLVCGIGRSHLKQIELGIRTVQYTSTRSWLSSIKYGIQATLLNIDSLFATPSLLGKFSSLYPIFFIMKQNKSNNSFSFLNKKRNIIYL